MQHIKRWKPIGELDLEVKLSFSTLIIFTGSYYQAWHQFLITMATMQAQLLEKVYDEVDAAPSVKKVTIVGVGQVGMACAYSVMQQVKRRLVKR